MAHFDDWDMHVPGRYRDLVFSVGSEQVANIEMLATMVAQLLEHAPPSVLESAVRLDPAVAAVIGGTDLQQAIAAGAGPQAAHNPWQVASSNIGRNLAADFQSNADAELNRRMQLSRLYRLTDDADVRYLLSFLLVRAAANQQLCRSAAAELKEGHVVRFRRSAQSKVVRSQELAHPGSSRWRSSPGSSWSCELERARVAPAAPRRIGREPTKPTYLFRGVIRHVDCGRKMEGAKRSHAVFYRCAARTLDPGMRESLGHRPTVHLREDHLAGEVNRWIGGLFSRGSCLQASDRLSGK